MSYKCEVCGEVVGPRVPLMKNVRYRTDEKGFRQIEKEIPVCEVCLEDDSTMSPWLKSKLDGSFGKIGEVSNIPEGLDDI